MQDSSRERLLNFLDSLTNSHDKIRRFESEGCTKEQLEEELRHIRDVAGNFPSIFTVMLKESPSNLSLIKDLMAVLRPPFVQLLNMQLVLFTMNPNPDKNWIKMQIVMALGNLNSDGYIDGLKAFKEFFR